MGSFHFFKKNENKDDNSEVFHKKSLITASLVNSENSNQESPKFNETNNGPVYPLYCPDCGKGLLSKVDNCYNCGKSIDYSRYDANYMNSLILPESLLFCFGTNEAFTYNLTNKLIYLYYLSTPESNKISIYSLLFSAKSNMESLNNPFGFSEGLEGILNELRAQPDDALMAKKLTEPFSSKVMNLTKDMLNQLNKYLITNSKGNYNYEKIKNYLFKQIFDKSIFSDEYILSDTAINWMKNSKKGKLSDSPDLIDNVKDFIDNVKNLSDLNSEEKNNNPKEARKSIPKGVKKDLWIQNFGKEFEGNCIVCNNVIDIYTFEAGHIESAANGGSDDFSNLKPICRSCNLSMGTMNLYEYKKKYYLSNP
jgi:hypothetical protein